MIAIFNFLVGDPVALQVLNAPKWFNKKYMKKTFELENLITQHQTKTSTRNFATAEA